MSAKETILARLRDASPHQPASRPPLPADKEVFADLPEHLLETFVAQLTALNGEVHVVDSTATARSVLKDLLATADAGRALRQDGELLDAVVGGDIELAEQLEPVRAMDAPAMAEYSVGVTTADCLIARSGSVYLTTRHRGGRRLSVLPPLHIVIAGASQLVPSLDACLRQLPDGNWSYGTVITGPSRTADIEKVLVLGAHGPKRLAVIVIRDC